MARGEAARDARVPVDRQGRPRREPARELEALPHRGRAGVLLQLRHRRERLGPPVRRGVPREGYRGEGETPRVLEGSGRCRTGRGHERRVRRWQRLVLPLRPRRQHQTQRDVPGRPRLGRLRRRVQDLRPVVRVSETARGKRHPFPPAGGPRRARARQDAARPRRRQRRARRDSRREARGARTPAGAHESSSRKRTPATNGANDENVLDLSALSQRSNVSNVSNVSRGSRGRLASLPSLGKDPLAKKPALGDVLRKKPLGAAVAEAPTPSEPKKQTSFPAAADAEDISDVSSKSFPSLVLDDDLDLEDLGDVASRAPPAAGASEVRARTDAAWPPRAAATGTATKMELVDSSTIPLPRDASALESAASLRAALDRALGEKEDAVRARASARRRHWRKEKTPRRRATPSPPPRLRRRKRRSRRTPSPRRRARARRRTGARQLCGGTPRRWPRSSPRSSRSSGTRGRRSGARSRRRRASARRAWRRRRTPPPRRRASPSAQSPARADDP